MASATLTRARSLETTTPSVLDANALTAASTSPIPSWTNSRGTPASSATFLRVLNPFTALKSPRRVLLSTSRRTL